MKVSKLNLDYRFPAPPLWLATFILVLIVFEVMVRTQLVWALFPMVSVEQRFIQPALERAPDPTLVFLGNSRMRVGVSPKIVGEILGIRSIDVANIAFDGGTPQEFLQTYEAHRPQIDSARVLIIGVEGKMFNQSLTSRKETSTGLAEGLSLQERLQYPSAEDKIDATLGWFWKTWEFRDILWEQVRNILKYRVSGSASYFDDLDRIMTGPEPETRPSASDFRDRTDLENFQADELQLQALQAVTILARQDGAEVLLVDAPLGPVYQSMTRERFSAEDAHWRQLVEEMTGLPVVSLTLTFSRCPRWNDCFQDEGHLNHLGAQGYSEDIGRWLLAQAVRLPLERAAPAAGESISSQAN